MSDKPTVSTTSMAPRPSAAGNNGASAPTPAPTQQAAPPDEPPKTARKRRSRSGGPSSKGSAASKGRKKKEPDAADFEWAGRALFKSRELGYESPEEFIADCEAFAAAWRRVHG